jgi:hypothetical protein
MTDTLCGPMPYSKDPASTKDNITMLIKTNPKVTKQDIKNN